MHDDNNTNLLTLSYLQSRDFQIPTNSIYELLNQLQEWIESGLCGAMIKGRSRIGKTSSILFSINEFHAKYGESFPIILWSLTEHSNKTNDKTFYASMLDAMDIDVGNYHRITALELKNRIISYLAIRASESSYRKIVLIIDEAYKLNYKEYYWLMDIYNILRFKYNVALTVFLFGTPREMNNIKKAFIVDKQTQIVERFLINEYNFHGIQSVGEMAYCLAELDKTKVKSANGNTEKMTLSEFYFPEAFSDRNACFFKLANEYWDSFHEIKASSGIGAKDIPMHYFMVSFILCLSNFGKYSNKPKYFLERTDIKQAIIRSGYGSSADE